MTPHTCPDCDMELEIGFVPDEAYCSVVQTCWHPGVPENSTFFGMQVTEGAVKLDRHKMIGITTYRCPKCGLLRSYAE